MIKKLFILIISLSVLQTVSIAKDTIQFDFPNDGWHKVASPDGIASKKCYVPYNQSSENFSEMLIFTEKNVKTTGLSPMAVLHRQLGKDRNNYYDIAPKYIVKDMDNAMLTWCSEARNTCVVERAFQGNDGVIMAIYMNKAPHYSQNMFGQWSNILANVKVFDKTNNENTSNNLIELD